MGVCVCVLGRDHCSLPPAPPPALGFPLVIRGREMRCFSFLSQKWANRGESDLLFRYSCSGWRLYT